MSLPGPVTELDNNLARFRQGQRQAKDLENDLRSFGDWQNGKKFRKAIADDATLQPRVDALVAEVREALAQSAPTGGGKGKPATAKAAAAGPSEGGSSPQPQTVKPPVGMPFRPAQDTVEPRQRVLGAPFLNPYSFLPFTPEEPPRAEPTGRPAGDDPASERFSGVVDVDLRLITPLLTSDPVAEPHPQNGEHKVFALQRVGGHPVLPATGVRGALRSMLEALAGTGVAVLADHIWLREGRMPNGIIGETAILAEVVRPGGVGRGGTVRLGETRAVVTATTCTNQRGKKEWEWCCDELKQAHGGREDSRGLDRHASVWANEALDDFIAANPPRVQPRASHPWRVRVSGMPVGAPQKDQHGKPLDRATKKDGAFRADSDSEPLTIPAHLWTMLIGLNYGGLLDERAKTGKGHIHQGDLVWIILKRPLSQIGSVRQIEPDRDIACLSWTRWARRGSPLHARMPRHAHPPGWSIDGQVDQIANLFGAVPLEWGLRAKKLRAFAGRIRPDNLVFSPQAQVSRRVPLAPLMPPRPGNRAFYREASDPDRVCVAETHFDQHTNREKGSTYPACPLRGYKVYRAPRVGDEPWRYDKQPVYDDNHQRQPQQSVNRTVDLLNAGAVGSVRLALRDLDPVECGLLLLVLENGFPWRLGGGKPLGLGCARVETATWRDDTGRCVGEDRLTAWRQALEASPLGGRLGPRLALWRTAQEPDENQAIMRYPRAMDERTSQRGGHAWFNHLAKEKMNQPWGLQRYGEDKIPGQLLPLLGRGDQHLYGYDRTLRSGGGRGGGQGGGGHGNGGGGQARGGGGGGNRGRGRGGNGQGGGGGGRRR